MADTPNQDFKIVAVSETVDGGMIDTEIRVPYAGERREDALGPVSAAIDEYVGRKAGGGRRGTIGPAGASCATDSRGIAPWATPAHIGCGHERGKAVFKTR